MAAGRMPARDHRQTIAAPQRSGGLLEFPYDMAEMDLGAEVVADDRDGQPQPVQPAGHVREEAAA